MKISIKFKIYMKLKVIILLEFIRFDKRASKLLLTYYLVNCLLSKYLYRDKQYYKYLGNIYRHVNSDMFRLKITNYLIKSIDVFGEYEIGKLFYCLCKVSTAEADRLKNTVISKEELFDRRLLILSPPVNGKKGVILIKFTDYFKYFISIFDIDKIRHEYVLVLEPSSCGYFDEDILCMMGLNIPVIVQTPELVDKEFLYKINTNLIPIDLGANYWVDDRVFFPIENQAKEYDVIMVAIWGNVKRHYHLFKALSMIKPEARPNIALVGVSWPLTIDEIKEIAAYYNVEKSLVFFENLTQQEINVLLSKAKATILLSKKEGFNKSIVEAMYANVPAFILFGHNFGYEYPYINNKTGGYIDNDSVDEFLENVDNIITSNSFSPREWVLEHCSIAYSTNKLAKILQKTESDLNISINWQLVHKVNNPNLDYYYKDDWDKFDEYYDQLKGYLM